MVRIRLFSGSGHCRRPGGGLGVSMHVRRDGGLGRHTQILQGVERRPELQWSAQSHAGPQYTIHVSTPSATPAYRGGPRSTHGSGDALLGGVCEVATSGRQPSLPRELCIAKRRPRGHMTSNLQPNAAANRPTSTLLTRVTSSRRHWNVRTVEPAGAGRQRGGRGQDPRAVYVAVSVQGAVRAFGTRCEKRLVVENWNESETA